jgi:hypothetical protein
MLWSLRKPIALIAAYSITLQMLFWGLAIGPHAVSAPRPVFGSLAIFCGSKKTGDAPPHPHQDGCGACAFACGEDSLLALLPGGKRAAPPFAERAVVSVFAMAASLAPAKHRPQTSRAPPIEV